MSLPKESLLETLTLMIRLQ